MVTTIDKSVPGFDQVYGQVGDKIRNFKIIKSLSLQFSDGAYDCSIVIVSDLQDSESVILKCRHLSKMETNFIGLKELSISGLRVANIRNRQMEDLHWEIGDYEEGSITLLCKDLSVAMG